MSDVKEWSRESAEENIHQVFDDAMAGNTQVVNAATGKFEVRFFAGDTESSAAAYLSQGGPDED